MPDVVRGRRKILMSIGGALSFMVIGILGSWRHGFSSHPLSQLTTAAILAALGFLMYRGVHWAREAVVIWIGLTACGYAAGGLFILPRHPVYGIVGLLFAAGFAYDVFVLYTSEDIEAVVNPGAFPAGSHPRR